MVAFIQLLKAPFSYLQASCPRAPSAVDADWWGFMNLHVRELNRPQHLEVPQPRGGLLADQVLWKGASAQRNVSFPTVITFPSGFLKVFPLSELSAASFAPTS